MPIYLQFLSAVCFEFTAFGGLIHITYGNDHKRATGKVQDQSENKNHRIYAEVL